jgi:DNA repair protein RadC
MTNHGSLASVLAADRSLLADECGGDVAVADLLGSVWAAHLAILRAPLADRPVLAGMADLHRYLQADIGHARAEQVRVLFLTMKNQLIRDEVICQGSLHEAPFYPREIIRRALQVGAAAMLVIHNHPSGCSSPSASDVDATRRLMVACRPLDLLVHDHLVVARNGIVSMRAQGLL